MCQNEIQENLRHPIIMIYLNKIKQRHIFEDQAFQQIMKNVNQPEILVQILNNYIHQAIRLASSQNQIINQNQPKQNVISNLSIEASMNVCNRTTEKTEPIWLSRNYIKENCKSVTHVRIAYFINQRIASEKNTDPLEYFENYRKANN